MKIYDHPLYLEDVNYLSRLDLPWEKLQNTIVVVSGATGMIGSLLIDVLMNKNAAGLNCKIYALGRSLSRFKQRFCLDTERYLCQFVEYDVQTALTADLGKTVDYVIHLASNTHPLQYSEDPIGTISSNVIGLNNLLYFSTKHKAKRFVFASSNEIYGENRGDVDSFVEDYCGYIDCNSLRAGYPESKRCGEALCQAYKQQKGLDIVVTRFTRTYGPSLLKNDSKALSQFLHKAITGNDIVLKSSGNQLYSYLHATDSVSGLLTILLKGENGQAYNIADRNSNIRLRDLAAIVAEEVDRTVKFEIPYEKEENGYSKVKKALLDSGKLNNLGWTAKYNIKTGIKQTVRVLKDIS